MRALCARCGRSLESTGPGRDDESIVRHVLCAQCAHHLLAMMGMPLREYLDGLGTPVVVVDADVNVVAGNEQLGAFLRRDVLTIAGYRGGDVFECAYASLPGGCGHTVHCSGCAIRRTVTETANTGCSRSKVPAILNHKAAAASSPTEAQPVHLLISTQKFADVVLLSVELAP